MSICALGSAMDLRPVLGRLLLPALALTAASGAGAQTLAVVGGTVIDGTGGPPQPDTTVLVEGERIQALSPDGTQPLPVDAHRIDANGRWVIPGLIDAHVHFFQSGGLYTRPDVIDIKVWLVSPEDLAQDIAWVREVVATAHAAGVPVVAHATKRAVAEAVIEAGLSPAQVLVAATRGGAHAMGRADELGTIAPGKLADLVILEADPLADIRNTRRVHGVIKGGQLVPGI